MSEWLMVPLSKSGRRKPRGFESRPLRSTRALAVAGSALYVVTLMVVPLVNTDRDLLRLHPEDLAYARLGWLVVAGWVVFAVALAAVAALAAGRGVASWIAVACFAVAALVCVANAVDPTLGTRASPIELGIFGLVIGPLVVSFTSGGRWLRPLALAAALAFLGMVFEAAPVGGLVNRVFDVLAAVWCIVFARAARPGGRGIMRPSGEVA